MQVMLVSHRFLPDDAGGVEQYTKSLGAELARRGDAVSIVARRFEHGRTEIGLLRERLSNGCKVFRVLAGSYRPERFLQDQPRIERLLMTALLESEPDVVHINQLIGFSPRLIPMAKRLGAAVVVSLHDFHFACPRIHLHKPNGELCGGPRLGAECSTTCFGAMPDSSYWGMRAMYFERALRMADRVIAYSKYVASYFQTIRGIGSPIEVIENGVLPETIASEDHNGAARAASLTLAYCGTVFGLKGPHVILEALRLAGLERVRLLVIGQTPDKPYAAKLRREAALLPGLQMQTYGTFARSELPLLLRGVDCVIVPSLVPEAGPIVPREALAAGVPVLASRLGALPELIVEGVNGLTFDPTRPAELAAILVRLASDQTLLARLREGARRSPVVTASGHAACVRAVYEAGMADRRSGYADRDEGAELDFLHNALLERDLAPLTSAPAQHARLRIS